MSFLNSPKLCFVFRGQGERHIFKHIIPLELQNKLKLPDMDLKEPIRSALERARLGSCRTMWREQR